MSWRVAEVVGERGLGAHQRRVLLAEVVVVLALLFCERHYCSPDLSLPGLSVLRTYCSPDNDRRAFLISRLMRAASCEDDSISSAHRLLSDSSFPRLSR